ncbi:TetR/AcrR family transcriptional regulator [Streptomyces sp. NBC_00690]|uniref:TetR/AcrR family transcriptional regulator n=1 Tax=Streptomyces sp. NBC_00690 TaxID=2975808 RepID=UPI002E2C4016|nr:TetR/AcrR family transcriptional regulator [Streptomyces sp. NBC_00690]
MTKIRGARERARIEVTAAIKDEARRQLAAEGAAKLSLRAVARELGMVSSALYRYFPSRDELLTALIVDAYEAVGAAAEAAIASPTTPTARTAADTSDPSDTSDVSDVSDAIMTDHRARWIALCSAVRAWALAHPHEYALIYGSPVPGYAAPSDTVVPASRVGAAMISVARDAHRTRGLALPPLDDELRVEAERLADQFGPDLPPSVVVALVAAWSQLFGLISFELFGQFHRVVEERDAFFTQAVRRLAHEVGLLAPLSPRPARR